MFVLKCNHQGGGNMISKQTRLFVINGVNYQFDFQSFKTQVKKQADIDGVRPTRFLESIAEAVNVTHEAVKQWYYGNNGPSELVIIKQIAEVLNVTNYLMFLKKAEEREETMTLNLLQTESLKRIYDAVIDYLDDFNKTDGFTGALWYKFARLGSKDPEEEIGRYAEDKIDAVLLVIQKEYFYLHDTVVYSDILEYAENDLYDIFDGKLSYAYRFEAVIDGHPTTDEDYSKALSRINEIIEKYV
jgi:transcriptional regulator with XRE-family HTH domain